jgi:penicillin-binding protein A
MQAQRDRDRSQRLRRARPVMAIAAVAFVAGVIVGANQPQPSSAPALAAHFAAEWAKGEYGRMYAQITPAARRATSPGAFAAAYREAAMLATTSAIRVMSGPRSEAGGVEMVPVRVTTRLWGTLREDFRLPVVEGGEGVGERIAWSRALAFPGLRPDERLQRHTALPQRGTLLARDGSVLAEGTPSEAGQRSSPLGASAAAVVGSVGEVPTAQKAALQAEGWPANALVGVSGLEAAFDERLRGTPGGVLFARGEGGGERVLASAAARPGSAVRTSVDPAIQTAAVQALGGQYGGVVALEPGSGEILGVAGIGLDGLQPPGSTFKMVTVTGVLQAGVARPDSTFPYATQATLDGVALHNSESESCGGTLVEAFAVSCNSVFAPLGVRLGAARLVATAEHFGFNQPSGIEGVPRSTIPQASQIQGELAVGSTAIGQDMVLATPLEMGIVAATIADGGRRPAPTFSPHAAGTQSTTARQSAAVGSTASQSAAGASAAAASTAAASATQAGMRAMSAGTARVVREMMVEVVRAGTGTAAAIAGVTVAGKTGTAELESPGNCPSAGGEAESTTTTTNPGTHEAQASGCSQNSPQSTDAWFASFAPALHPKIAVAVLLVRDGFGGATAAPVARQVLEAGLAANG